MSEEVTAQQLTKSQNERKSSVIKEQKMSGKVQTNRI